jgi:diketogulonate reductase-like aldo/keto reductase
MLLRVTADLLGSKHMLGWTVYQNQDEVGEGIQAAVEQGLVKPEDVWVTSKVIGADDICCSG